MLNCTRSKLYIIVICLKIVNNFSRYNFKKCVCPPSKKNKISNTHKNKSFIYKRSTNFKGFCSIVITIVYNNDILKLKRGVSKLITMLTINCIHCLQFCPTSKTKEVLL